MRKVSAGSCRSSSATLMLMSWLAMAGLKVRRPEVAPVKSAAEAVSNCTPQSTTVSAAGAAPERVMEKE